MGNEEWPGWKTAESWNCLTVSSNLNLILMLIVTRCHGLSFHGSSPLNTSKCPGNNATVI